MTDPARFRAEFPVLDRLSYLNAGTEGPLSRRAAEAVTERLETEVTQGRAGKPYFEGIMDLAARLRGGLRRRPALRPRVGGPDRLDDRRRQHGDRRPGAARRR